ncbi:hypothetical protein PHAVU_008G202800 [Phaseolus vulgaris]|uniref:Uncharacterized protein n=1 Tax=Phaseolus vulgaris TaxID=3885 RepID=V7BAL8_PHAVU|nr:hypothetical protein PHAVU_008G202800g [Phaseolus vulgaris]ESW13511.1 hypothetical protein PHAVU_008G202800g [Phaseolus vulgaris]
MKVYLRKSQAGFHLRVQHVELTQPAVAENFQHQMLKYPHMAIGVLASSTLILYFDDITAQDVYYSIVSRDF